MVRVYGSVVKGLGSWVVFGSRGTAIRGEGPSLSLFGSRLGSRFRLRTPRKPEAL